MGEEMALVEVSGEKHSYGDPENWDEWPSCCFNYMILS